MNIEVVSSVTDEILGALRILIPQLTNSPANISKSSIEELVDSHNTFLLVARDDENTIVGTLTLVIFTIPTNRKAFIEDVVVDANAQGGGIGRKLIEAAIELAKINNVARIELSSNPSRIAANGLYQKIGFEIRDTNFYRLQL